MNYNGNRSTWQRVEQLLIVTYVASITKSLIMLLYLNRNLFHLGKAQSSVCSFSHTEAETTFHVFHKYSVTKIIWNQLLIFFETDLDFPDLTPQAVLFGFINESDNNLNKLQNHVIKLFFKLYVYQSREKRVLNLNSLIRNVAKVKN